MEAISEPGLYEKNQDAISEGKKRMLGAFDSHIVEEFGEGATVKCTWDAFTSQIATEVPETSIKLFQSFLVTGVTYPDGRKDLLRIGFVITMDIKVSPNKEFSEPELTEYK